MNVDSIRDGIVIDHIAPGNAMKLYDLLGLAELDVPVAMITNVVSAKRGRKDIIKIDAEIPVDINVIGYVDPEATVNMSKEDIITLRKGTPLIADSDERKPLSVAVEELYDGYLTLTESSEE